MVRKEPGAGGFFKSREESDGVADAVSPSLPPLPEAVEAVVSARFGFLGSFFFRYGKKGSRKT